MTTVHYENGEGKEKEQIIAVKPLDEIKVVKIREVEKTVEKPVYVEKEFVVEKPVYKEKEYEIPVYNKVEYEVEKPIYVEKEYEKPVINIKEYEVALPVIQEQVYKIPVPQEVPYDVPVVEMEKLQKIAGETVSTLLEAKNLLGDLQKRVKDFDGMLEGIKKVCAEDIKVPKRVEEEYVVKVPKLEYETVRVIGKIVAREA